MRSILSLELPARKSSGVGSVKIHVDVNLDLAAQYGLTLVDVQTALNQFHAERPGGSLDTGFI